MIPFQILNRILIRPLICSYWGKLKGELADLLIGDDERSWGNWWSWIGLGRHCRGIKRRLRGLLGGVWDLQRRQGGLETTSSILLQLFVLTGRQSRLHGPTDRIGTAAVDGGQLGTALPGAVTSHQLALLAVAEPGGSHGRQCVQQSTVGTLVGSAGTMPPVRRLAMGSLSSAG